MRTITRLLFIAIVAVLTVKAWPTISSNRIARETKGVIETTADRVHARVPARLERTWTRIRERVPYRLERVIQRLKN
jgi:hypothetical protein